MALYQELDEEVKFIFSDIWKPTRGDKIPTPEDIGLGNHSKKFEATMLYADLSGSTKLVDTMLPHFAAEVYKAYVLCAVRIIKSCDGHIRSFDGDRVMALFKGDNKNTNAVKAALRLNGAVAKIINPALAAQYKGRYAYTVKHSVGIDTSDIYAVKIGIKGTNDIVWVGKAANHAAKLSTAGDDGSYVYISEAVFNKINEAWKISPTHKVLMWQKKVCQGQTIYRSGWSFYDFGG